MEANKFKDLPEIERLEAQLKSVNVRIAGRMMDLNNLFEYRNTLTKEIAELQKKEIIGDRRN